VELNVIDADEVYT